MREQTVSAPRRNTPLKRNHTVARRHHDQKIGVGGPRIQSMGENRGPTASLPSSDSATDCAVLEGEIWLSQAVESSSRRPVAKYAILGQAGTLEAAAVMVHTSLQLAVVTPGG